MKEADRALEPGECMLTPRQLSRRHQVSEKKLAHDRLVGRGVRFYKIGRLCRYRLSDVIAYETARLRQSTSGGLDA